MVSTVEPKPRASRGRKECSSLAAALQHRPGLFLGWKSDADRPRSIGFHVAQHTPKTKKQPLLYRGDGHLMTVAPTGAGKGIGVAIPNLLTYPGSVIAVDVKGELAQVTARRRREMGQKVVILDPFGQVTDKTDALNPFDLFKLPGTDAEADAEMLAAQFAAGHEFQTDRYWDDTAKGIMSGLIAHLATAGTPDRRNLTELRKWLHDHLDDSLLTLLEEEKVTSGLAKDEFLSYLSTPSDKTRPCIRSTAISYVKCLGSKPVERALGKSSFDLNDLLTGQPITVYLVFPPDKLESHRALLRAWVATLLTTVLRRKRKPKLRTLFLLDEVAQLGAMPLVRQAITLLRGYGLQCWTFWQDLGQLKELYPKDWTSFVSNAAVLQVFGVPGHGAVRAWDDVLPDHAKTLSHLPRRSMLVASKTRGVERHRRANYLTDPAFANLYDANERFEELDSKRPTEKRGR